MQESRKTKFECSFCRLRVLTKKQMENIEAGKLNVMVVSSLFSMQVLTHVPVTGVQALNGKL